MEKKAASGIMLTLLLIVALTLTFNIRKAKASGTIYIRPDGSVEGTDRIQRDGDVYTFTDNIYDSIVVEKDNIVVDGADHTLHGTGAQYSRGVDLTGRSNLTIGNVIIEAFWTGIWLNMSSSIDISGNTITNNIGLGGLWLSNSSGNLISENNIVSNGGSGIQLFDSLNNTIEKNDISENNAQGGVFLSRSSNNTISGNNMTSNDRGIMVHANSFYNLISGNYIADSEEYGVALTMTGGYGNIISENTITNNEYGISVWSFDNFIYHNSFVNNTQQVDRETFSLNTWDDGYPSGGNYWSDYTTKYPDAQELDHSGIWDTPYVIHADSRDRYPLMNPWTPTQPSQKMIKPVKGEITSPYGWRTNPFTGEREFHKGIDIDRTANLKTVKVPADGTVDRLGFNDLLAGNWVVMRHESVVRLDGETKGPVFTKYFHLDSIDVTAGQELKEGDLIGTVGETSAATGPHLHFEVWEGDSHVDPILYVDYHRRGIVVNAHSPVDIILTDPDGSTVSKESIEMLEIASYLESDLGDRIWITERKTGDYLITIIPESEALPTDTYTLEVSAGNTTIVLAEDVPVSDIPSQPYVVEAKETGISQTLTFNAVWESVSYPVLISSNSTVTLFIFSHSLAQISFEMSGEMGTVGYSNVAIPKALLRGNPWTIKVDNVPLTEFIRADDENHCFLFFTYTHTSTSQVTIQGTWVVPGWSSTISCNASLEFLTLGEETEAFGQISPVRAGVSVTVTYVKPDGTVVETATVSNSSGFYHDLYAPDNAGLWTVYASWLGDNDYQGATSPSVAFNVTSAETFPIWIVGVTVATIAIATAAIAVFWRKRKQPPTKE